MTDFVSKRKPIKPVMAKNWWLKNPFYLKYMLREATSIFAVLYSLILFSGFYALTQSEQAFVAWLEGLKSPGALVFHLLAFVAMSYHAITWFNLAPKTVYLEIKGKQISAKLIEAALLLSWFGFSALVLLLCSL